MFGLAFIWSVEIHYKCKSSVAEFDLLDQMTSHSFNLENLKRTFFLMGNYKTISLEYDLAS